MKIQHSNKFKRFLSNANEKRKAANHLSENIRLASQIAKVAVNRQSRENAYKLKYSLLLLGLVKYDFKVQSYELHHQLGIVLLVSLSKGTVHIPLKDLTEIQSIIDITVLPYRVTLPLQKRQRLFKLPTFNFWEPAFC